MTDLERALRVMLALRKDIDSRRIKLLSNIVGKNQNCPPGDGSFDPTAWEAARVALLEIADAVISLDHAAGKAGLRMNLLRAKAEMDAGANRGELFEETS